MKSTVILSSMSVIAVLAMAAGLMAPALAQDMVCRPGYHLVTVRRPTRFNKYSNKPKAKRRIRHSQTFPTAILTVCRRISKRVRQLICKWVLRPHS